jgi:hypothetical protein
LLTKAVTTALVEVHDRKLDTETLAMQKRMTERASQAYLNGGGGFMGDRTLEKAFIVPDREKDRRLKKVSFTLYLGLFYLLSEPYSSVSRSLLLYTRSLLIYTRSLLQRKRDLRAFGGALVMLAQRRRLHFRQC